MLSLLLQKFYFSIAWLYGLVLCWKLFKTHIYWMGKIDFIYLIAFTLLFSWIASIKRVSFCSRSLQRSGVPSQFLMVPVMNERILGSWEAYKKPTFDMNLCYQEVCFSFSSRTTYCLPWRIDFKALLLMEITQKKLHLTNLIIIIIIIIVTTLEKVLQHQTTISFSGPLFPVCD